MLPRSFFFSPLAQCFLLPLPVLSLPLTSIPGGGSLRRTGAGPGGAAPCGARAQGREG
uniref:Uncharacterized protein n=1 Tax=Setaria viridis TaxID=4556 RepID=A0A4V6D4A3_SETVI|nr:hypothetical protein SEVIR_7G198050v2 [Setaria viridis]